MKGKNYVRPRGRFIQVRFSYFFEMIPLLYQLKSTLLSAYIMNTQVLYSADVVNFLDFELDLVFAEQVNQILSVDLDHRAAQFVIRWQLGKDFAYNWGNQTIIVAKHGISLSTACAAISENGTIIALNEPLRHLFANNIVDFGLI